MSQGDEQWDDRFFHAAATFGICTIFVFFINGAKVIVQQAKVIEHPTV